jgi:hypothetical protein
MDDTACSRPTQKNQSPLARIFKTILASRFSYKIASIFTRHTRSSSSTPFPFGRLPYDIRVIIYSYLENGQPLAPRFECLGFYLSCQQFKREIEEFSRDRLRSLFTRIENALSVEVAIKPGLDELRSITVVLPYAAFDDFGASSLRPKWKYEILRGLHPLLAYPFDTLHIEISSDPECDTRCAGHAVNVWRTLRYLIGDLGLIVEFSNMCKFRPRLINEALNELEKLFKANCAREVTLYPTKVKTRQICLSWDHQTSPRRPIQLSGRMIYSEEPHYTSKRRWPFRKEKKTNPLSPANPPTAIVYELCDAGWSVGEMGIVSPTRWSGDKFTGPLVTSIINSFDVRRGILVSSKGIGMEPENGVAGVKVQELEDEEDRRYKEAKNMAHDDMMTRAYIDDGIMPY